MKELKHIHTERRESDTVDNVRDIGEPVKNSNHLLTEQTKGKEKDIKGETVFEETMDGNFLLKKESVTHAG